MTRINLVPPSELSDQHLFSEFREIKMVPKSLARSISARGEEGALRLVRAEYTLGRGHVSFFYNKGEYLRRRDIQIRVELTKRRVNFNKLSLFDPDGIFGNLDPCFNNNYIPTDAALALIRARLAEKIAMKPSWYRWTSTLPPVKL